MTDFRADVQQTALSVFRKQKALAEKAMAQVSDAELFTPLDRDSNSIAVIVRHLHGNMRSRWTDLLTSDGEKDDRHRDDEFIDPDERTREQVMTWWERGWQHVFAAIEPLTPEEMEATVTIRGEPLSVTAAIFRQVDHYAQHIGQIILIARHLRGAQWETLSIPRGKSEEYLRRGRPPRP
jgi:hypothetical protein